MARPPWSRPASLLLDGEWTAEDRFALLERAGCLSAKARAQRLTVIALLERTAREFQHPAFLGPPGWEPPSLSDEIHAGLRAAGYLDTRGWEQLLEQARPDSTYVDEIIADVLAARGSHTIPPIPAPAEPPREVTCPQCRRPLPGASTFCGYCGVRLRYG